MIMASEFCKVAARRIWTPKVLSVYAATLYDYGGQPDLDCLVAGFTATRLSNDQFSFATLSGLC